jgi:hypothetical protein
MTSGRLKGSAHGRDKGRQKGSKNTNPPLDKRTRIKHHNRLRYSSIPTHWQRCPKCNHLAKSTPYGMLHYKRGKFIERCQWGATKKTHRKHCPCVLYRLKKKRKMEGLYVARVICISGSRSFNKYHMVLTAMENMKRTPLAIVSGCARGADMFGELWAKRHDIPIVRFPADWPQYGKAAGAIRNKQMVEYADEFVIFWDGVSPGTKHMIETVKKSGKHMMLVKYKGDTNGERKKENGDGAVEGTNVRQDGGAGEVLQPELKHTNTGSSAVGGWIAGTDVDDNQAV